MPVMIIPNMQPAAAAAARRTAQCNSFMQGYTNDGATSEQMRYYADCVTWLHPIPDDPYTLWSKAIIIGALTGLAIGTWMFRQDDRGSWIASIVFGGMAGAVAGGCVPAVIAGMWYGAKYLVS